MLPSLFSIVISTPSARFRHLGGFGAEAKRHAFAFERVLQARRDFRVLARNDLVIQLDHRDLAAQAAEHLAELEPQIVAAERDEMSRHLLEVHDVAVGQIRDLIETGNGQDAGTRAGVDEDFFACERLAVDLDLMRAGEAAMSAIEGEIGRVGDSVLDAGAERVDDLVLARDDLGHVHLDLAGVNAELRRAPDGLGDASAGDHRLGGRAAVIDARAAELALLD